MLIIGKHKIDDYSVLPNRAELVDDDALIYDALFRGGVWNTGLRGSYTSNKILKELILSPCITVEITLADLSGEAASSDGITDPNHAFLDRRPESPCVGKRKGTIPIKVSDRFQRIYADPSYNPADYISDMAGLRMILNHELSHAHTMMTYPSHIAEMGSTDAVTKGNAYFNMEFISFDRDAEVALDLDDIDGTRRGYRKKIEWGVHTFQVDFTRQQLLQKAGKPADPARYGERTYLDQVNYLADYAIQHLGNVYTEWKNSR